MIRYGFIGLGHLGGHLAASLLRGGFPIAVHDREHAAATPLLAQGATWAAFPRELAGAADAVITCLPSPKATSPCSPVPMDSWPAWGRAAAGSR
jgi:3-hydroxyisobutyrate dehydrogenase